MKSLVLAFALGVTGCIIGSAQPVMASEVETDPNDTIIVTVDRAKLFRVSRPAATIIIGNPSIADATVEDERTLVLTGRSFGVTNIIILDADGEPIVDRTVVVRSHEANTVRVYRRASRETYACAPVCEPTLTIGDNESTFGAANDQIKARNALNEESATVPSQ